VKFIFLDSFSCVLCHYDEFKPKQKLVSLVFADLSLRTDFQNFGMLKSSGFTLMQPMYCTDHHIQSGWSCWKGILKGFPNLYLTQKLNLQLLSYGCLSAGQYLAGGASKNTQKLAST
jgi:hypothetical protein